MMKTNHRGDDRCASSTNVQCFPPLLKVNEDARSARMQGWAFPVLSGHNLRPPLLGQTFTDTITVFLRRKLREGPHAYTKGTVGSVAWQRSQRYPWYARGIKT